MDDEALGVERVRVAVRVRPRNQREEALKTLPKPHHVLDVNSTAGQIYVCKRKSESSAATVGGAHSSQADRELRCNYDRVFDPSASQDDVFEYVRDSVQQVAQGFNCTIFAYGQTGTGKTHTMLGKDLEKNMESIGSRDHWGVIPRAVESLFVELESIAHDGAAAAIVYCSYMQIFNNEVYDLLQENKKRMKDPLAVREMIKGNDKQIYVSGLSEFRVASLEETLRLLRQGNKNRTIRATEYNEKSSRSHALLQLSAEVESRGAEGPTTIIRRAKLNLVDLAGSEKWDVDVSMGSERCKELTSINQSLSALGNVISALANPKRSHVPYRDAKLTRLLQDSLGGNTRTIVLATISQDESAIEETITTLLFADRAKCVTLRVKANEVVDDAVLLAQARREIARLRLAIKKNASHEQFEELEQKMAKLSRENAMLASENKRLKQAMATMKKERAKAIKHEHPETRSELDSGQASDRLVGETSDGKSQRVKIPSLKLDLEPRHPAPPPPRSSGRGIETHDEAYAQRVREEQNQALLLEQIQSERRALEEKLGRIEQLQTPRRLGESTASRHSSADANDDACPICGVNIDDHTDQELDFCIEQETVTTATTIEHQQNHEEEVHDGKSSHLSHGRISSRTRHPSSQQLSLPPRTPPATRKPTTPRSSNIKKPTSPYMQDLFAKPQAPSRANLNSSSKMAAQRSVRDLLKARGSNECPARTDESPLQIRPSSVDTSIQSNTGVGIDTQLRRLNGPIVHQGSKSVKALKKFQAASPYCNSQLMPEKRQADSNSPLHHVSGSDNNASSSNGCVGDADRITCSLRDIGLSLEVYKFRYDCWYPCTVVGFDAKRKLHCCQYEYGDKQWQDLAQNKTKMVGRSGPHDM